MHTKKKFWKLRVRFQTADGPVEEEFVEEPSSIVCFPNIPPGALPTTFACAGFIKDHAAVIKEQQEGILASFTKLDLEKEHGEWDNFWDALPADEQSVQDALLFALPQKNKSDKVGKVH